MDILIQTYLKPLAGMNSFQILGILFGFGFLASQAIQRMVCLQQSGKYIKENRPLWDDGILPFLSFLLLLIFGLIVGIQYAMEGIVAQQWFTLSIPLATLAVIVYFTRLIKQFGIAGFVHAPRFHLFCLTALGYITFVLYSFRLTVNAEFFNDEHYMLKAAYGFLNRKDFVLWDLVQNQVERPYPGTRIYTVLLALIYHFTGPSVYAGRLLSVCFAVVFIPSVYYVFEKIFSSKGIGVCTATVMMLFTSTAELARMVRFHSLSYLAGIWLFYFGYQTIMCGNTFKKKTKLTHMIQTHLDYNIKYFILFLLSLFLNTYTLVYQNPMFLCFGLFVVVLFMAVKTGEAKYKTVAVIGAAAVLLAIITWVFGENMPGPLSAWGRILRLHLAVNFESPTFDYFIAFLAYPFGLVMGILLFLAGLYFLSRNWETNAAIPLIAVSACFLLCSFIFVFFVGHTFQVRHMIFAMPLLMSGVVGMFHIIYNRLGQTMKSFACFVWVLVLVGNFVNLYNSQYFADISRPKQQEAYFKIKNYIPAEEPFLVTSYLHHSVYLGDYPNSVPFDHPAPEDSSGIPEFIENGKKYPTGIYVYDEGYVHMASYEFEAIRNHWMDQISGPTVDNTGMYIFAYHYVEDSIPANDSTLKDSIASHLFEVKYSGLASYIVNEKTLYLRFTPTEEECAGSLLLVRFQNKNGQTYSFQLRIPDMATSGKPLYYKLNTFYPVFYDYTLSDSYAVYIDVIHVNGAVSDLLITSNPNSENQGRVSF